MAEHMKNVILLEVRDLTVSFPGPNGPVRAVNGVSYAVRRGEIMGIIGESGSGKSMEAYAVMGLLPANASVEGGSVLFDGRELLGMTRREMEAVRGREISMIFQDPMASIDPVFTIGNLLTEVLRSHDPRLSRADARSRSIEMLRLVGIRDAEQVMRQYQNSLSGGMRQRVMIAAALLCSPKLLIADEPTTALDVTIQDQILRILKDVQKKAGMSMIFITHNFGIVADLCDRVTVMYGGSVMEQGPVDRIFHFPAHPYTKNLFAAMPRLHEEPHRRLTPIGGAFSDDAAISTGCAFAPRCAECLEICRRERPVSTELAEGHSACCWLLQGKEAGNA